MLVPCGTASLPAKLSVRVISARGLPVMDKCNVTTDAFVEVHFDNEVESFLYQYEFSFSTLGDDAYYCILAGEVVQYTNTADDLSK